MVRLRRHRWGQGLGEGLAMHDLEPLRGLRLVELDCGWTQVGDLTPLRGMPLARLSIAGNTGVRGLAALGELPRLLRDRKRLPRKISPEEFRSLADRHAISLREVAVL